MSKRKPPADQDAMPIEDQKYMALEGIHTWAEGVIAQVRRINASGARMLAAVDARMHNPHADHSGPRREFERERYGFLMAAHQLCEHVEWARKLDYLNDDIFKEILSMRGDIRTMRDLNEHRLEYFLGRGQKPDKWWDISGSADASATVGSKIGDRLDWKQVAAVAKQLVAKLPAHYWPRPESRRERLMAIVERAKRRRTAGK